MEIRDSNIYWFTSQMTVAARSGPSRNQELGILFWFLSSTRVIFCCRSRHMSKELGYRCSS